MRRIKSIQDIVDWGLCVGCGACLAVCERPGAVNLVNIQNIGIRPRFNHKVCRDCTDCLRVCPGHSIDAGRTDGAEDLRNHNNLIGPSFRILEGHASDPEIRFRGSSGGIITAMALYALEQEKMGLVLHTGMDPEKPWLNKTVISRNRAELINNAGSRYASSSPCEMLRVIEESEGACVFIGKPCDAAAVHKACAIRPRLKERVGLVLSFFCAGTPSTQATLDLMHSLDIDERKVSSVRYRGEGWPGKFRVDYRIGNRSQEKHISYMESWRQLARKRPFRCNLCPDGLGELADVSCGDAWNRYEKNEMNAGLSHVLTRSIRGDLMVRKALGAGYLAMKEISTADVISAQGLVQRRREVFGRCLAMKMLSIPTTRFDSFDLFPAWRQNRPLVMVKSVFGTLRRLIQRGLWHPNPVH